MTFLLLEVRERDSIIFFSLEQVLKHKIVVISNRTLFKKDFILALG